MARAYNEFSFKEDAELMNLTYQMNTGNFTDYEDDKLVTSEEDMINNQFKKTKFGL